MARAIIINVFFSSLLFISGFLSRVVYSYLVDKKELAVFYVFLDLAMFISLVSSGLKDSTIKNYRVLKSEIWQYFFVIASISCFLQSIILVVFCLRYSMGILLALLFLAYFILMQTRTMLAIVSLSKCKYRVVNLEVFIAFFGNIVGVAFVLFVTKRIEMILLGGIAASVFGVGYMLKLLGVSWGDVRNKISLYWMKSRQGIKKVNFYLRHIMIASAEYVFSGVSNFLSGIMLLHLASLRETGDFVVVAKPMVFMIITIFVFPLARFTLPEFSRDMSDNNNTGVKKNIMFSFAYVAALLVFPVIFNLGASRFIYIVFPSEYMQAAGYINILSWVIPLNALGIIIRNYLKAQGYFVYSLSTRVLAGVSFFVFAFIFKVSGVWGICLAVVLSEILAVALGAVLVCAGSSYVLSFLRREARQ